MPKTDKVEYERRLFTIQGWIIEGVQSVLIIQQILAKNWCTSIRQAERMLRKARERWIIYETGSVEDLRKLKIAELKQLKRSLKEVFKGTPSGILSQLAVEKEIIKLEGITPAVKHELSGPGGNAIPQETIIKVVRVSSNRNNPAPESTLTTSTENKE